MGNVEQNYDPVFFSFIFCDTFFFFLNRYGFLVSKNCHKQLRSIENPKEATCYLLNNLDISVGENTSPKRGVDYELGETKLFMRNRLAVDLDAICTVIQHRSARIIQEAWRRRGDGLYERARQNAATIIQSYFRGYLARCDVLLISFSLCY